MIFLSSDSFTFHDENVQGQIPVRSTKYQTRYFCWVNIYIWISFSHLLMICEYGMLQPYNNNKNLVIMFNTLVYCLVAVGIVLRLLAIRILFKWNCQLLESDKRPFPWPAVSYKAHCCLYRPRLYFISKLWLVVFPPSKHTWPHWTFISCNFSMRFYMCCNLKHRF